MNVYVRKQNIFWQKVLAGAGVVVALIIFLNLFNSQVRNSFYVVTSPLSSAFMRIGANGSSAVSSLFNVASLKNQNIILQQQNQDLLNKVASLQDSIKTQQAADAALNNTKDSNFTLVAAKPIGLDLQQDVVTIDKGSADGVSENMPVISQEKIAYGKVVKVYNNFSHVQLISAKTSVTDVKIQNDDPTATAINGAIKGSGELGIYLDLVAADAQINQNDVLVTSGLDGIYPRDLLVGRIDSWNKNDVKPFQTAKVSSFSDIKNAENLFIIVNYKR